MIVVGETKFDVKWREVGGGRWWENRSLGDIAVSVLLPLHSFQVLLFDKDVDAFLDDLDFRLESCWELV